MSNADFETKNKGGSTDGAYDHEEYYVLLKRVEKGKREGHVTWDFDDACRSMTEGFVFIGVTVTLPDAFKMLSEAMREDGWDGLEDLECP